MKRIILPIIAFIALGCSNTVLNDKTVLFGQYYQTAEGDVLAPIEWDVLDNKDGLTLLITSKTIDSKPFHSTLEAVTWGNFSLRHHYVNDPIIGDRPAVWVKSSYLKKVN